MSLRQSIPHHIRIADANQDFAQFRIDQAPQHGKRVIVCGGRDYNDFTTLSAVLTAVHRRRGIKEIIEGDAPGADKLAGVWANRNGVRCTRVPAEWDRYGKRAGPRRNHQMLDLKPDVVIVFPGKRGTHHMMTIAREANIPVWQPLARKEPIEFPDVDPIEALE
jgi:hypothetical protein